ncbi:MAG: FAD-dependent oxidoreductase [Myxococcales bacterium]|nr:FAD-dependent oxidoreductase [Myxococcales bacterium]
MTKTSVLVVGASLGGWTVAEALRRDGFTGRLTLLGAEPHLPYDRPPLSKRVLLSAMAPSQTQLRPQSTLDSLSAEFLLSDPAVRLDASRHEVHTESGRVLSADVIVLATGLVPKKLPGQADLSGVYVLRTLDDAVALQRALQPGKKLLVVGDGVLGTEIAATACSLGLDVTLLGPQSLPMQSQLGPLIGSCLAKLHTLRGVSLRLGVGVASLRSTLGVVTGVCLQSGEELSADLVVVAMGSRPATDWLVGSGLQLADGVVCDSHLRAARDIYAVGDVARFSHEKLGTLIRLENRTNAVEQGLCVAANILGTENPYLPVPYFWTDQFDVKIQAHGFIAADAEVAIVDGDPDGASFVALYGSQGKVTGLCGWNAVRQIRQHRPHVMDATSWQTIRDQYPVRSSDS